MVTAHRWGTILGNDNYDLMTISQCQCQGEPEVEPITFVRYEGKMTNAYNRDVFLRRMFEFQSL